MNDISNDSIRILLTQIGITGDFTLQQLPGGANNRAFRLDAGGQSFLLKAYFRHPDDPRDRLGADYAFSSFAWDRGIRCIPQPLAADATNALGLYAFVPGRAPQPEDVSAKAVDAAMDFYTALNNHRNHPQAASLPNGSESCFSLRDHLQTVERRIQRLNDIPPGDARDFVQGELRPLWGEVVAHISGSEMDEPLPLQERCLSPSDFGFHNAIITEAGEFVFIDFEYAGWDDPAKMVCDFFCQPRVPVPMTHYNRVSGVVSAESAERISTLLPVYQIKWCCIMLNHLLPAGRARRQFAGEDAQAQAQVQLEKAKTVVEQVRSRIR